MKRLRPAPLPTIHPLPEYLAEGQRRHWYEEVKTTLQIPWMGVVAMAYAHYPTFFDILWGGLKPLAQSRPFVEQAQQLRELWNPITPTRRHGRAMKTSKQRWACRS